MNYNTSSQFILLLQTFFSQAVAMRQERYLKEYPRSGRPSKGGRYGLTTSANGYASSLHCYSCASTNFLSSTLEFIHPVFRRPKEVTDDCARDNLRGLSRTRASESCGASQCITMMMPRWVAGSKMNEYHTIRGCLSKILNSDFMFNRSILAYFSGRSSSQVCGNVVQDQFINSRHGAYSIKHLVHTCICRKNFCNSGDPSNAQSTKMLTGRSSLFMVIYLCLALIMLSCDV